MFKILIVEDDSYLAKRMIRSAKALDMEVVWVDCGSKANDALFENEFDLISIDGSFPAYPGAPIDKIGAKMVNDMNEDGIDSCIVFYSADPEQVRLFKGSPKVTPLLKKCLSEGVDTDGWAIKCQELMSK